MRQVLGFRTRFPSVRLQCGLCGKPLEAGKDRLGAEHKYVTRAVQRFMDEENSGDLILCHRCEPIVDEYARQMRDEETRLDAEHQRSKEQRLTEFGEQLMSRLVPGGASPHAAEAPATPADTPSGGAHSPSRATGRKRRPGSIPAPNSHAS